jgi:hypothetical protein
VSACHRDKDPPAGDCRRVGLILAQDLPAATTDKLSAFTFRSTSGRGTRPRRIDTVLGPMLKRALRTIGVLAGSILIAILVIALVEMSGVNLVKLAE